MADRRGLMAFAAGAGLLVVALVAATSMRGDEPKPRTSGLARVLAAEPRTTTAGLTSDAGSRPAADAGSTGSDVPSPQPDLAAGGTLGCGAPMPPGVMNITSDQVLARGRRGLPAEIKHSLILVPERYDGTRALPLIVVLSDARQEPEDMLAEATQLVDVANAEGVLLLFAEANRPSTALNQLALLQGADRKTLKISSSPWNKSHVPLLADAIGVVKDAFCVDPARIFLLGNGRGGRGVDLALGMLDGFAAAAVTDYVRYNVHKVPPKPRGIVPFLMITPTDSPWFRRNREKCGGRSFVEVQTQVDDLKEHHRCRGKSVPLPSSDGGSCFTWACGVAFVSCEVDGGVGWPGDPGPRTDCDGAPPTFDYGREVWNFFSRVSSAR